MAGVQLVRTYGPGLYRSVTKITLAQGAAFDVSGDVALNTAHRNTTSGNPHNVTAADIPRIFEDHGEVSSGTVELDVRVSNHRVQAGGDIAVSITNIPDAGIAWEIILELVNGAAHNITWPDNLSTDIEGGPERTVSGTDVIKLFGRSGGDLIYAQNILENPTIKLYGTIVFLGHSFYGSFDLLKLVNVIKNGQADFINSGIFSNRYDEMDARFSADVTPYSPDLVVLSSPVTSIKNLYTLEQIQASFNSIKSKCDAIGADLITEEVTPWAGSVGGGTPWTPANQIVTDDWNAWLEKTGVPFAKVNKPLEDPADPNYLLDAYTDDELHLNAAGRAVEAKILARLFRCSGNPIVSTYDRLDTFRGLNPQKVQNHTMDKDVSLLGWVDETGGDFVLFGDGTIGNPSAVSGTRVYHATESRDGQHEIEVKWPSNVAEVGYIFIARYEDVSNMVYAVVISETSIGLRERIGGVTTTIGTDLTGLSYVGGQMVNFKIVVNGADILFEADSDPTKQITYSGLDAGNVSPNVALHVKEGNQRYSNFRSKQ